MTRTEIEQTLLGAILYSGNRVLAECVRAGVEASWFSTEQHRQMYHAAVELYAANRQIEATTLESAVPGIMGYCTSCVEACITPSNYREYITIFAQTVLLQRMKDETNKTVEQIKAVAPAEVGALLTEVQRQWLDIGIRNQTDARTDAEVFDAIQESWGQADRAGNIRWPIAALNSGLGWLEDELCFVCARESIGKTAFVLQMLAGLWGDGVPASLLSLESKRQKILQRLMSFVGQVDTFALRAGTTGDEMVRRAREAMLKIAAWKCKRITDCGMNMTQIRAWAQMEKLAGSKLLVIDNFKHIRPAKRYNSTVEQFRDHSMQLKWIRDDIGLPMIILHHLNKELDLSWSDDLRRDADIILILTENETMCKPPVPAMGDYVGYWVIDFEAAKNRDGRRSLKYAFEFDKKYQTFKELNNTKG